MAAFRGKQVGLCRDLLDRSDDVGDIQAGLIDLLHGGLQRRHQLVAASRRVFGFARKTVGFVRVLGGLTDLYRHLVDGGADFGDGRGRLGRAGG